METDELGYAAILTRVFKNKDGKEDKHINQLKNNYLSRWQCPTVDYCWRGGIKAHIPDFFDKIDNCSPKWTADEIDTIRENIRELKVIPTLKYIPDEFYNFTKKVWWLIPFTIWKEEIASWIFIDKNGFHAPHPGDNDGELIYAWDQVEDMEIEWPEDNLCMLTVYNRESEGFLTFAEFVSEGCGSYLSIIPEIYEIFQPVIEASRGGYTWKHGAGAEGYQSFETDRDLLDINIWKQASYYKAGMFA